MFGSSTSRTCAKSSGFNKRGAAGVELAAHVTEAVASTKRMSPKNRTRFICGMACPGRRASIPNSGNQFWQGHTAIGRETFSLGSHARRSLFLRASRPPRVDQTQNPFSRKLGYGFESYHRHALKCDFTSEKRTLDLINCEPSMSPRRFIH